MLLTSKHNSSIILKKLDYPNILFLSSSNIILVFQQRLQKALLTEEQIR